MMLLMLSVFCAHAIVPFLSNEWCVIYMYKRKDMTKHLKETKKKRLPRYKNSFTKSANWQQAMDVLQNTAARDRKNALARLLIRSSTSARYLWAPPGILVLSRPKFLYDRDDIKLFVDWNHLGLKIVF